MKYAAIDIGTNSCRLFIAEFDGKRLIPLYKDLKTTRIGQGLNDTGLIKPEALSRTLACLTDYHQILVDWGVAKYQAIATSAVREAINGQDFVQQAAAHSRIKVDIISGEAEARLSYQGVVKGLSLKHPPLVVDLGGGSMEFICEPDFVLSIPLGAVRATELNMSAAEISRHLDPIQEFQHRFGEHQLVFTGGTASSLAAIKLGLATFEPSLVHGCRLSRTEIDDLYELLARTPLSKRRGLPGLQPERADIIVAGALIVKTTLAKLDKTELYISENDLLQGIIWSLIEADSTDFADFSGNNGQR